MRWNTNIHYHRRILDAVPSGARTALDVGTGNGLLAAELRAHGADATGIDSDAAVLDSARREDGGVTWVRGDVMTYPFPLASFDVVASVAAIHHLPGLDRALARLAALTAPGGVVAVVGLARSAVFGGAHRPLSANGRARSPPPPRFRRSSPLLDRPAQTTVGGPFHDTW